jgi:hypothetical protein
MTYKKGDMVEIIFGWPRWIPDKKDGLKLVDVRPQWVGRKAEIEYSYKDRYGIHSTSEDDANKFSIKFTDTGDSISWFEPFQFKLIKGIKIPTE